MVERVSGHPVVPVSCDAVGPRDADSEAFQQLGLGDMRDDGTVAQSQAAELLAMFGRHWLLFAVVSLVLFAAGTAIVIQQPKQYTANTTVLFDPRNRQIVNFTPVLEGFSADSQTLEVEVATEQQLILSRRVTDPVIVQFDLLNDPEFNGTKVGPLHIVRTWFDGLVSPIEAKLWGEAARPPPPATAEAMRAAVLKTFAKDLSVEVEGHSTAIRVSFTSESPRKAVAIANAIASNYVDISVTDKAAAVNSALETMTKRSAALREQVIAADSAVEDYRIAAHLVEGSGGSVIQAQITEFNSQLVQAEADLATARSRLAQIESVKHTSDGAPAVLASPVIQQLRAEEARQSSALARDQATKGQFYPGIEGEKSALAALRQQIDTEIANIARAQQAAVQAAQVRVDLLKANLADIWKQAGNDGAADIHLRQLKLEATVQHTLYESYLRRIQEISQQVGTAQPYAEVISPAELPDKPSWPELRLLLPAILLVSLALASFAVVCAEVLGMSFRSLRQVADVFGGRPIELIPRLPRGLLDHARGLSISGKTTFSPYDEAIHALRIRLRNLGPGNPTILFSSAIANEGKTTTAVAFARQEAQAGLNVLMIDADMRSPSLHRVFGGSVSGLAEILLGKRDFDSSLQRDLVSGLAYLSAGQCGCSPIDLLASAAMMELLRRAEQRFDRIVIDSPPALAVADARVLTALASRTMYIVRWGSTPRRLARLGLELLRQSGGHLLGPIFVQVDGHSSPYSKVSNVRRLPA